jgi:hypothetical protein
MILMMAPAPSLLKVLHDLMRGACIPHPIMNSRHVPDDGASILTCISEIMMMASHTPPCICRMILMMAPALYTPSRKCDIYQLQQLII